MGSKGGCPHVREIETQSIWCCYIKNSMVSIKDCHSCPYGKPLNVVRGGGSK